MLSQNIKILRMQKGLTQKELADLLHVTSQAVSRWEKGDVEPSIDTINNMAKIFEVSTDEIINGIKEHKIKKRQWFNPIPFCLICIIYLKTLCKINVVKHFVLFIFKHQAKLNPTVKQH